MSLKTILRQFAHTAAVALALFSASLSAETYTNDDGVIITLTDFYYTTEEDINEGVPAFDATQIGTYSRDSGTGVPETSLFFDDRNPTVGFVGELISSITPTSEIFTNPYPRFISGGHLDAVSLYTQTVDATTANNPPVGVEDAANTFIDTPVNINVLANDSDIDGDSLSIISLSANGIDFELPVKLASGGTVTVNDHGTPDDTSDDFVVYTPAPGFVGRDTFRYRLSDGTDAVDVVVTVVITEPLPVNTPPVANPDTAVTTSGTPVDIDVLANDTDPDPGTTLSIETFPEAATLGTVARNRSGGLTYTPRADAVGTDTFDYRITDGTDTAIATVTVTIAAPLPKNRAPLPSPDEAATAAGTAIDINVLVNDVDPDGDSLTIQGFTQGSLGRVTGPSGGILTYTPAADASGTDTFTYTVSDGTTSAGATVKVTILAPTTDTSPTTLEVLTNPLGVDASEFLDPAALLLASASEPTAAGATAEETLLILSTHEDSVIEYCLGAACSVTGTSTMEVNPNDVVVVNVTTDSVVKAIEGDYVFVGQPETDIDAIYYTVGSSGSATVVFSVDGPSSVHYAIEDVSGALQPADPIVIDTNDLVQCLVVQGAGMLAPDAPVSPVGRNLANCSIILDPDGVKTPDLKLFSLSGIDVNGVHVRESSVGSDVVDSRCPEELANGVVNLEWCPILLTVDTPTAAETGLTITGSTTDNRFTEKVIVQSTSGQLVQFDDLSAALHGDVGREQLYGFFLQPGGNEIQFLVNRTDQIFKHNSLADSGSRFYTTMLLNSDEVSEPHPHDVNVDAIHVNTVDGRTYFSVARTVTAGSTTLEPHQVWAYDPDGLPTFSLFWSEPSEPEPLDVDGFALLDETVANPPFAYSLANEELNSPGVSVRKVEGGRTSTLVNSNAIFPNNAPAGSGAPDVDGISIASDGTLFFTVENDNTSLKKGDPIGRNDIFALTAFGGNAVPQPIFLAYDEARELAFNVSLRPFVTGSRNVDGISIAEGGDVPNAIDRFRIEPVYGGSALTCEPDRIRIIAEVLETVTGPYVTAQDYVGDITISTTTANADPSQIGWAIPAADDPLYPKNPTFFADNGDGTATYRFVAGDLGELVVDLAFPFEELVSINVDSLDGTDDRLDPASAEPGSADPPRNFARAGLRFYEGDNRLRTQIAGKTSNELPNGGGMSVRVVADGGSGACVAACSGPVAVEFAYDCVNPATGVADAANCSALSVDINGTAITPRASGYTVTALNFSGADSVRAPFEFKYNDAAKLRLWARITGDVALNASLGIVAVDGSVGGVSCAASESHSNDFVVRPFAFGFSDIAAGDGARAISASNPGGTAEAGTGFVSAGSKFDYVLGAYLWDAADDRGTYDLNGAEVAAGQPDGHPDPGVDVTTHSGAVGPVATRTAGNFFTDPVYAAPALLLSANGEHYTPNGAGSVLGTLTDPVSRTNSGQSPGTIKVSGQAYSEVGSIQVLANQVNYLRAGDYPDRATGNGWPDPDVRGLSPVIGRFFPDRFALLTSNVGEGTNCSADDPSFVYMDEPDVNVEFSLQAQNAFGAPTSNYNLDRGYALDYLAKPLVSAENENSGTDLVGRLDIQVEIDARFGSPLTSWGSQAAGEGALEYLKLDHTFRRPVSPEPVPDGPYSSLQIGLSLTGVDAHPDHPSGARIEPQNMNPSDAGDCAASGNCDSTALAGALDVRYGRANLQSGAGSSAKPIALPVNMEYWDGNRFMLNEADNCTALSTANFTLTRRDDDADPDTPAPDPADGEPVGSMTVQVDQNYTRGKVDGSEDFLLRPVTKGDLGLVFSPPGSGNTGFVDIRLQSIDSWLVYDFSAECGSAAPCAEVHFGGGRRSGDDNVIYWKGR